MRKKCRECIIRSDAGRGDARGVRLAPAWRVSICRVSYAAALLSAAIAPARAAAQAGAPALHGLIVVSNERSHDLTLVDPSTFRVLATIPVGARARGIRIAPDGRTALVALSGDSVKTPHPADGIGVVDLASRRMTRRLKAGTDPEQFAITPDGRRIFVSNEDAGTASSID